MRQFSHNYFFDILKNISIKKNPKYWREKVPPLSGGEKQRIALAKTILTEMA